MKKLFSLVLILGLAVMLVAGCSSSTSTPSADIPAGASVASQIGLMAATSTQIDATAKALMGFHATHAVSAMAAPNLTYDSSIGWWTFTYTAGTSSYDFKAKAYTALGTAITTTSALATTNKLEIALSMQMTSDVLFTFGTESDPMIFDGLLVGTKSLNGPLSMIVTDAQSKTYTVSYTYSGVQLDASGLPASGSVSFTFSSSDYATVAGTITFNGATANLVFTSPSSLTGTTYVIDMLTGIVTTS
ncbi:MAG: hypothetical protein KJ732_05605 [Candidatus Margulisbacteria bacterium]|nr:hypothetical protein [Candidatus Margulisiibacteriota bacterium]